MGHPEGNLWVPSGLCGGALSLGARWGLSSDTSFWEMRDPDTHAMSGGWLGTRMSEASNDLCVAWPLALYLMGSEVS